MSLIEKQRTPRQDFLFKLQGASELIGVNLDQLCYRSDIEPADFSSDLDGSTSVLTPENFEALRLKLVALMERKIVGLDAKKQEVQSLPAPRDADLKENA